MKTMNGWDVYLGDQYLDTHFFKVEMEVDEVKQTLIDKDGYDPAVRLELFSTKTSPLLRT